MTSSGDMPQDRPPAGRPDTPRGGRPAKDPHAPPGRRRRRLAIDRLLIRLITTVGIVGVGVAIGAIMRSSGDQGWLIGLVVSLVTLVLAVILRWAARRL